MKLDVGCGNNPKGDINCDLYVKDKLNHRNLGAGNMLHLKRIPNFVLCDARYLPFKDLAFSDVYCAQVIEHLPEPLELLKELCRVCAFQLIVETVHRWGEATFLNPKNRRWFKEHHISKFNLTWFARGAPLFGFHVVHGYTISHAYFPTTTLPVLQFPYEIGSIMERNV